MAGGYSKLYSGILTSSIWCEPDHVLRVWIAMLAHCDAGGYVPGSIPGFASMARVGIPEMRESIKILSSPDPDSRNPDNEGRRIKTIDGGWQILNYPIYRGMNQDKPGSNARPMREMRLRKKSNAQE